MAHIAKRDQFMDKGQCLIIAGNYLFGWNTMTAGGNSGRHTGNIDLRVGCQDIITADEKVGTFARLRSFRFRSVDKTVSKQNPLCLSK